MRAARSVTSIFLRFVGKGRPFGLPTFVGRVRTRVRSAGAVLGEGGQRLQRELSQSRLGRSFPVRLVVRVVRELGEDDATHMAASVSYYALLSLFPLILGISAVIGLVAGSEDRQMEVVDFVADFLPGSEQFVQESVTAVVRFRGALGIASILGLLWTASAVFGSMTRVVNRAWDVHQNPPFLKNKPRQLAMALGVGAMFALSLAMTSFFQWATSIEIGDRTVSELVGGTISSLLLRTPALLITFSIFLLIYKYLPNTTTRWRHLWLPALMVAVSFELAKNLFVWYLENFAQYNQLYGNISAVVILMVWIYASAFILIIGAEIAAEYDRMKRGVARGRHE